MSYLAGQTSIASGASSVTVTYVTPFTAKPDVVLAVVVNTTDSSILLLNAHTHTSSNTGFTAQLDGVTDSANYILTWIVGSMAVIFQTLSTVGIRIDQLRRRNLEPDDNALIPLLSMSPLPKTETITWGLLKQLFVYLHAAAPVAANSPGNFGGMAVDASYVYLHDGTNWVRIPREPGTAWGSGGGIRPVRRANAPLTMGQKTHVITFDEPFTGMTLPRVVGSLMNLEDDPVMILHAIVTSVSLTGFTVVVSSSPDSSNYIYTYTAEQL